MTGAYISRKRVKSYRGVEREILWNPCCLLEYVYYLVEQKCIPTMGGSRWGNEVIFHKSLLNYTINNISYQINLEGYPSRGGWALRDSPSISSITLPQSAHCLNKPHSCSSEDYLLYVGQRTHILCVSQRYYKYNTGET